MIILSSHASDRIKERSIKTSEIETTIVDPDKSIKKIIYIEIIKIWGNML